MSFLYVVRFVESKGEKERILCERKEKLNVARSASRSIHLGSVKKKKENVWREKKKKKI